MVDIKEPQFQEREIVDIESRSIVHYHELVNEVPIKKEDALRQLTFIQNIMAVSSERNVLYGWKYRTNENIESNFMDLMSHLLKKIEE